MMKNKRNRLSHINIVKRWGKQYRINNNAIIEYIEKIFNDPAIKQLNISDTHSIKL